MLMFNMRLVITICLSHVAKTHAMCHVALMATMPFLQLAYMDYVAVTFFM